MSDELIRIAPGQVTAYELLTTDSYLVSNWPRTSDMPADLHWQASQPEKGLQQELVTSLGRGGGGYYGSYSGLISFFILTPFMRQYLFETIMQSSPVAMITAYLHTPNDAYDFDEMQVVYGEMLSPIASNAESDYARFTNRIYHTLQYPINRAEIQRLNVLTTLSGAILTTLDGKMIASLDQ